MLAIASRNIYACRDTLAAGLAMRRSGSIEDDVIDGRRRGDITGIDHDRFNLPEGMSVSVSTGRPHDVTRIDPLSIEGLHAEALDLAWADGAWDVQFLRYPPLSPYEMGNISANHVYEDASLLAALLASASAGRLCTWSWRPMRFAPATRSAAHQARDVTLDPDGGRRSARPDMPAIKWAGQGGCAVIIRMGRATLTPPAPPSRGRSDTRATRRQRHYIIDLRRQSGIIAPLPAALTRAEASAIIDALERRR